MGRHLIVAAILTAALWSIVLTVAWGDVIPDPGPVVHEWSSQAWWDGVVQYGDYVGEGLR